MFGVTLEDPEVAFVPDQAPEAVQDVALVEDQVSVEDPLYDTDVGLAEILTVGAGVLPPPPLPQVLVSSHGSAVTAETELLKKPKATIIKRTDIIKNFLYIVFYYKLINQ